MSECLPNFEVPLVPKTFSPAFNRIVFDRCAFENRWASWATRAGCCTSSQGSDNSSVDHQYLLHETNPLRLVRDPMRSIPFHHTSRRLVMIATLIANFCLPVSAENSWQPLLRDMVTNSPQSMFLWCLLPWTWSGLISFKVGYSGIQGIAHFMTSLCMGFCGLNFVTTSVQINRFECHR